VSVLVSAGGGILSLTVTTGGAVSGVELAVVSAAGGVELALSGEIDGGVELPVSPAPLAEVVPVVCGGV